MKEDNQGFEPKGTKISPAMAVVWDAVLMRVYTGTSISGNNVSRSSKTEDVL